MTVQRPKTLAELKAAMSQREQNNGNSRGPNNYFPFWNIPVDDKARIRFLPDKDPTNPFGFFVVKYSHTLTINGKKRNVVCPKTYDEGADCPICAASSTYFNSGDRDNGLRYWKRPQYIAQALVLESSIPYESEEDNDEGKVKLVALGRSIYKIIEEACADELEALPYDYEEGTDFTIKKTMRGEYADYSLSKFARKSSELPPEAVMELENDMVELKTVLPTQVPFEKLEAMLEADMTGTEYNDDDSGPSRAELASKINKMVKSASTEEDDDDGNDEEDAAIQKILAKQRTQQVKENVADDSDTSDGDDVDQDEKVRAIMERIKNRS